MVKKMLLTLVVLAGLAVPAFAADDDGDGDGCTTTLAQCYEAAAKIENFWYRWAAGIDCELNYIECARIKIVGR